ncbi:MAG: hypothetical protein WHT82_08175 [Limisphaera sp.]
MKNSDFTVPRPGRARIGWVLRWTLAGIAAGLLLAACRRESTPPPASETTPAPASETQTPTLSEADIVSNHRLLDYLENLMQRKEFDQARRAISELESRPMTPAQRQRLQQLKAQLPPG